MVALPGRGCIGRALRIPLVCALLGVVLSACGAASAAHSGRSLRPTATPPVAPTSLTVLRYGGLSSQNRVAPFQMTVQSTASVEHIYHALFALPPIPEPPPWCPQDAVIGYRLSFMQGKTVVFQALLEMDGCLYVSLSNPRECRLSSEAFYRQLAATLGVAETTLKPPAGLQDTAGLTGPFAPYAPPPPVLTNGICGPYFPTR